MGSLCSLGKGFPSNSPGNCTSNTNESVVLDAKQSSSDQAKVKHFTILFISGQRELDMTLTLQFKSADLNSASLWLGHIHHLERSTVDGTCDSKRVSRSESLCVLFDVFYERFQ